MSADLSRIFKAYDVRGVVPDELDADLARRIGAAFAEWSGAPAILLGRDCRLSSPELAAAIAEGATSRGVDVVDIGLASTDLLYFASGSQDLPGIMLTASHNPKQYNGLKFCLAGAKPVGEESGLREIRGLVEAGDRPPVASPGSVSTRDLLDALRRARALVRRRGSDAPARRGGGHGQRDGRPGGARRDGAAARDAAPPLSRSWTARSRTILPTRSTRRTSGT